MDLQLIVCSDQEPFYHLFDSYIPTFQLYFIFIAYFNGDTEISLS